jgi:chromosome segregation ATPase
MRATLVQALVLSLAAPVLRAELPVGQLPAATMPSQAELEKPVVSATGKQRLRENITILENNIKDLKDNIATSDKNLDTIRAELKDLDSLEKEHLDLRKKYEGYLAQAESEVRKNEKARRDLAKWEEGQKNAQREIKDAALQDKLEAARLEQVDRERWKADAASKMSKVKELMSGVDRNLRDIRSRRRPLEQQLNQWTGRRADYQKQLTETDSKRATWEKALNR